MTVPAIANTSSLKTRTYGSAYLSGDKWKIECEPHVSLRIGRILGWEFSSKGIATIPNNRESCFDIKWVNKRYPLRISDKDSTTIEGISRLVRICRKCLKARSELGTRWRCKPCACEDAKDWARKNPERVKAKTLKRYWSNPALEAMKIKKYRLENLDRIKLQQKESRAKRPGYWRGRDKVKACEASKRYYKKHYEKVRKKWGPHQRKRRAQKKGAKNVEVFYREEIFIRDKGKCRYCGNALVVEDWHLDHVIPLCKGGDHTRANTVASCPRCNLTKHTKLVTPLPIPEG